MEPAAHFNVRGYLGLDAADGPGYERVAYTVRRKTRGAITDQPAELRRACEQASPLADMLRRDRCSVRRTLTEAADAELGGTVPMWQWIGDEATVAVRYEAGSLHSSRRRDPLVRPAGHQRDRSRPFRQPAFALTVTAAPAATGSPARRHSSIPSVSRRAARPCRWSSRTASWASTQ